MSAFRPLRSPRLAAARGPVVEDNPHSRAADLREQVLQREQHIPSQQSLEMPPIRAAPPIILSKS
jgi:hypothetical protein